MERLTERFSNGEVGVRGCGGNCKYGFWYCHNHLESCPSINEIYKKLAEYEDLAEQGKLLELPAAIGDEIFFIFMDCPKDFKVEYCRDHEGSCENCHHRVPKIVSRDFSVLDIPIIDKIFATREEAEAALHS